MRLDANLTTVKIRRCTKCWRVRQIQRHHKGQEYFWSQLLPDHYKERYDKFLEEDIVRICDKCHKTIHIIYSRRLGKWGFWALLARQNGKVTYAQAEHYRKLLIRECDKWLARGQVRRALKEARRDTGLKLQKGGQR